MVNHYVECVYRHGTYEEKVSKRDADEQIALLKKGEFVAFRFFDKTELVVDGETLTGEKKNFSGWYFRGEKLGDWEIRHAYNKLLNQKYDYNRLRPKYYKVIREMERAGCDYCVKTDFDFFFPLTKNDTIIY